MIWGGISSKRKPKYVNNKGFRINSETYIDTLKNYLLKFTEKAYPDEYWILMDDNARSHVSKTER